MADAPSRPDAAPTGAERRKPFDPPMLSVYGDMATLTQTVGRMGMMDGGMGMTKGTRV